MVANVEVADVKALLGLTSDDWNRVMAINPRGVLLGLLSDYSSIVVEEVAMVAITVVTLCQGGDCGYHQHRHRRRQQHQLLDRNVAPL